MTETTEERIKALVEEALTLRYKKAGDPQGALGDPDFSDVGIMFRDLERIRKRDDRVDKILSDLTRYRWALKRARDDKAFDAEIAFDEKALDNQTKRAFDQFSSREERVAEARIGSLAEKRALRAADRLLDVASEAVEVVTQIHWQFASMRKELVAAMRAFQIDQNLGHS